MRTIQEFSNRRVYYLKKCVCSSQHINDSPYILKNIFKLCIFITARGFVFYFFYLLWKSRYLPSTDSWAALYKPYYNYFTLPWWLLKFANTSLTKNAFTILDAIPVVAILDLIMNFSVLSAWHNHAQPTKYCKNCQKYICSKG